MRKTILNVTLVLILMLTILSSAIACGDDEETVLVDPIKTDAGLVSGTTEGDTENLVHVYRGIPYAAPPVGELRWMPPQPVVPWDGILDCTQFGPMAPQPSSEESTESGISVSEDCLYLNVNTPANNIDDRLPVMVWFHGGGITTGTGNSEVYNAIQLPQHGVVTVTINQRLGPMGYMVHPLLSAEQGGASGNYGTMDQIYALEWVQRNIAAFGGDPNRVTIFGQSGGGTKVATLLVSPEAKELFHRAIIQAGAYEIMPDLQLTQAEAEAEGLELMETCGAANLEEMRALPWETIIKKAFASGFTAVIASSLTVDGQILPDMLYNLIVQEGQQNDVPLIIGANSWENIHFENTTSTAEAWSKVNSNCYVYVFAHMPSNWSDVYPVHGFELAYLFGCIDDPIVGVHSWYEDRLDEMKIAHSPSSDPLWPEGQPSNPDPGLDESDYYVSETMMSMWAQFAATGDPNAPGLVTWPVYDPANPQCMEIADPLQVKPWIKEEVFPATTHQPSEGGLTVESSIGEIMEAPGGEEVLRECLGDSFVDSPYMPMMTGMTLPDIAPLSDGAITDEHIACVDAGLKALTP